MRLHLPSALHLAALLGLAATNRAAATETPLAPSASKPPLTLDDHFNYVTISAVAIAPDGTAVVVGTTRADWEHERFRQDLWLWRESTGRLDPLTQSGHDSAAEWSPDGQWIAFLSDRAVPGDTGPKAESGEAPCNHLYVIPTSGGESFQVTRGEEAVHAFTWAADSKSLFFATRIPWTDAQKQAHKAEWRDVARPREDERGDALCRVAIDDAIRLAHLIAPAAEAGAPFSPGAVLVASLPWRVGEIAASPKGQSLALVSQAPSENFERPAATEVYLVDLGAPTMPPRQITHNECAEASLRWHDDCRTLTFRVDFGSAEGPYRYEQSKLYALDTQSGALRRWAPQFRGAADTYHTPYALCSDGALVAPGVLGTEKQLHVQTGPETPFVALPGHPGSYSQPAAARHGSRLAIVYSALGRPAEVYLAESRERLAEARPITTFNAALRERALPQGKPYRWRAPDGTAVEGMLLYPPGRFEARRLKTLVLIHGGPTDADGNDFILGVPFYDWATLAAAEGWLVFQPNYRGSCGYGDEFCRQVAGPLVSLPGKDILAGVDALVREGLADPDHLAIGGYSYGGYLTNWLITQTDRFKAAVSGAGAVEHAVNWGLDDVSADDECLLAGTPWSNPQNYLAEAALFQAHKIRTPTLISCPADDVRVAAVENRVFERALHRLGVPCSIMIFPGEGHPLDANPWHGRIKVREELKWIERYAGNSAH